MHGSDCHQLGLIQLPATGRDTEQFITELLLSWFRCGNPNLILVACTNMSVSKLVLGNLMPGSKVG